MKSQQGVRREVSDVIISIEEPGVRASTVEVREILNVYVNNAAQACFQAVQT